MPASRMLSTVVPDFYAGFQSCGTGTVTNWLFSGIRKTQVDFTRPSKQEDFRSTCHPGKESILC